MIESALPLRLRHGIHTLRLLDTTGQLAKRFVSTPRSAPSESEYIVQEAHAQGLDSLDSAPPSPPQGAHANETPRPSCLLRVLLYKLVRGCWYGSIPCSI